MSWWVIPEGTAGQVVGQIVRDFETGSLGAGPGNAGVTSLFTVTQSNTKPPNAAAGPFATQAEAQAKATEVNQNITSHTTPTVSNVVQGASGWASFFQANIWIRVGEVLLGLVLIAVGLARITNVVPIATKIAGAVR